VSSAERRAIDLIAPTLLELSHIEVGVDLVFDRHGQTAYRVRAPNARSQSMHDPSLYSYHKSEAIEPHTIANTVRVLSKVI
jgi:hypothetical protein